MFRFIKRMFFVGLTILSRFTSVSSMSCISMNNQACKELMKQGIQNCMKRVSVYVD